MHLASPTVESRATQPAVPASVRKTKTVRFSLQEQDSQKRSPGNKDPVPSKTSPAARHTSTKHTQTNRSDMSEPRPKHSILLNSSVKYTHTTNCYSSFSKQENSQDSGAFCHSVSGTHANRSLLKSTSHTVTLLTRHNQEELISSDNYQSSSICVNTFSEKVSLQMRKFKHYTYSAACNCSAKNTKTKLNTSTNTPGSTCSPNKLSSVTTALDGDLSLHCTPRKRSTSAQRDRNNTNHHENPSTESAPPNRHASLSTPEHAQAYSNTPAASKQLLSTTPRHTCHQLSGDTNKKEDFTAQHAKTTFSYSATNSQPRPANPTDHPTNLLPEDPSKNFIMRKSLSTPCTHGRTGSHTPNASEMPKLFNMPQNPGLTATPCRPPPQAEERAPHSGSRSSTGEKNTRPFVRRPQENLDLLSSFMTLRNVSRYPVEQRPEATPLRTTGEQTDHVCRFTTVQFHIG